MTRQMAIPSRGRQGDHGYEPHHRRRQSGTEGANIAANFKPTPDDEAGCLVTYKGAQARYTADSHTYDIRFIAVINTLDADKVGFVFSKTVTVPTRDTVDVSESATSTVYTQITALGETVTAESLGGTYIIACTVTGIPEGETDVELYVRAFSTVGTATKYTSVRAVTVNDLLD